VSSLGPKTPPTGRPPPGAKPGPPPERAVLGVPPETLKAWRVKNVYAQERGRWESLKTGRTVVYTPPTKYDGRPAVRVADAAIDDAAGEVEKMKGSVWQKIVDWCRTRKLPPEAYVRQCFANVPFGHKHAPEPGQLLGDTYHDLWKATFEKRQARLEQALRSERETAARHVAVRQAAYGETAEFATAYVLLNGAELGLSPLFRYCFAVALDTVEAGRTAARLEAAAVLQFETNRPLHRLVWAEFLPPGFAARAKTMYPYLLAKLWSRRKTQ